MNFLRYLSAYLFLSLYSNTESTTIATIATSRINPSTIAIASPAENDDEDAAAKGLELIMHGLEEDPHLPGTTEGTSKSIEVQECDRYY